MRKYAGEFRVDDIWTEHPRHSAACSYRVIAIAPGLAPTVIRVTGESVTTGHRRTLDFFLLNRVEVSEETDVTRWKTRAKGAFARLRIW
jgi:hypothetical protein